MSFFALFHCKRNVITFHEYRDELGLQYEIIIEFQSIIEFFRKPMKISRKVFFFLQFFTIQSNFTHKNWLRFVLCKVIGLVTRCLLELEREIQ